MHLSKTEYTEGRVSGTLELAGRTQMQNFKFHKGLLKNLKITATLEKNAQREKTKLYKKTREETWEETWDQREINKSTQR